MSEGAAGASRPSLQIEMTSLIAFRLVSSTLIAAPLLQN